MNNAQNSNDKPAVFKDTPQLTVFDNSGRVVRRVDYYRAQTTETLRTDITHTHYDAFKRTALQRDPRLFAAWQQDANSPANIRTHFSLSQRELAHDSLDAGQQIQLFNDHGQLHCSWDSNQMKRRMSYDRLARPEAIFETQSAIAGSTTATEKCVERFVYQDHCQYSHKADELKNAQNTNQIGQLIRHHDSAGVIKREKFTLTGLPKKVVRQFITATESPSWPAIHTEPSPLVETESYVTERSYNALGELIEQIDAKGHKQRFTYNNSGQLISSTLTLTGNTLSKLLVSDLDYSPFGQRITEKMGNGVITRFEFEPETQRLLRTYSTRTTDNKRLQDLHYRYDPVGNIISIEDQAQLNQFHNNQQLVPIRHYGYDSHYQLTQASGRESSANQRQNAHLPNAIPFNSSPDKVSNYQRRYHYDSAGNLIRWHHQGAGSYTNKLIIAPHSNRALLQNEQVSIEAQQVDNQFDANGNAKQLCSPSLSAPTLHWDQRNQLKKITLLARKEQADDEEIYHYDSAGQRVSKIHSYHQSSTITHTDKVRYLPGIELRTHSANSIQQVLQVLTLSAGERQIRLLHWENDKNKTDQLRYSLSDQLNSSTLELDENAQLLTREEYYPYGGTALWAAKNDIEAKYKFVRYSGKERDTSGLYYHGRRYYAPWLGRWINPDPAGTIDGLNLYRMASNNPIRYRDPSGLNTNNAVQEISKDYSIINTGTANMTTAKRDKIINAYHGANQVVQNALNTLNDASRESRVNAVFNSFFGARSNQQHDSIKQDLIKKLTPLGNINITTAQNNAVEIASKTRFFGLQRNNDHVVAIVHADDIKDKTHRIFFNQSFFTRTKIDASSTIIHENSHLVLKTHDYFYNAAADQGAPDLKPALQNHSVTPTIQQWAEDIKSQGPAITGNGAARFIALALPVGQNPATYSLADAIGRFKNDFDFRRFIHLNNAESIALLAMSLAPDLTSYFYPLRP
ncbi:RHS repeat-associated core domain-containing protein [Candidatus Regiella endosymbiont of Tuberolachnus salignus]|uniref:RHS repeat-associated core domain-containing protein n=1 Tax=Candidatus Regiella endosymbiont of Tuberolachnus salignus TaxID=3077956 RepID=UPI0030CF2478